LRIVRGLERCTNREPFTKESDRINRIPFYSNEERNIMQSRFRNALLAVAALAAVAYSPQAARAQSAGAVTITVSTPTEFAGRVLAPGTYVLRPATGQSYLTLQESGTNRTIGFVRYKSVSERDGDQAEFTTTALAADAPAKLAITSIYIPAVGREFWFATPERPVPQQIAAASISSSGK
jgi:hypothetical protein